LIDGLSGTLAFPLRLDREVDHHDRVLLYDAEQHNQTHECVQIELFVEQYESEQRSEYGGRQS